MKSKPISDHEAARAGRAYWLERGDALTGPRAVHPDTKWLGYDLWTRAMLQRWTLARIRAHRPRYRRAVDLGCGFGDWTEMFASLADEIHGCDLSPRLIEQARARLAGHPAANLACSDLRGYTIPRALDFAYLGAVLMYLPDGDALDVLRRVQAAALPGALVVVRDFCAFNLGARRVVSDEASYTVYRRPEEVRALAERAGLRCEELRASPRIYADVMATRAPWLAWPLRAAWRVATAVWQRASHTLLLRA